MTRSIKYLLRNGMVVLLCLLPLLCWSQSKEELEQKREQLLKEISFTRELLEKTKKTRKVSLNQLTTLRKQIDNRENLIATIRAEIRYLSKQITDKQLIIESLEEDLEILKEEYAKMVVAAYKTQTSYNRLLFIFSAPNFNALYRRFHYLRRYAEYRREQADLIRQTREDLLTTVEQLNSQKREKEELLVGLHKQQETLKSDLAEKDKMVEALSSKEEQLAADIEAKKKAAEDLEKAISEIIRKEREAAEKRGEYELTPEARELSANFKQNRGKLPWPVEKGVITGAFGEHQHPVLKRVKTKNNGVDIQTDRDAEVRALFEGKVVRTLYNPSFHHAVMIRHGEFYTVYSNLSTVYVKSGEAITTKQRIGKAYAADEESGEVHIEIWQGNQTLNPTNWLFRAD